MSDNKPEPIVANIMRQGTPFVTPDTPVPAVAKLLVDLDIAGVPVVENDNIVGIVTEADVIGRQVIIDPPAVLPFLDAIFTFDAGPDYEDGVRRALAITARDLMTEPVINIKSSATLTEVATVIMDRKVNPVPVLDENLNYVGLVSRRDLVVVISALENARDGDEQTVS